MRLNWILSVAAVSLACATAVSAQMTVHAVSGTVKTVTPTAMEVSIDGTSTSWFKVAPGAKVNLAFENDLRSDAVAADQFHKQGAFVVVYFYGFGSDQTAVAVKELSSGPYAKIAGKVTAYDHHEHKLTVQDDAGKSRTFALADHLIVDTDMGADDGHKYTPHKGDDVRVTYASNATPQTVAFVRSQN